jgi:tetratricopeptide (TPR) repeat protein
VNLNKGGNKILLEISEANKKKIQEQEASKDGDKRPPKDSEKEGGQAEQVPADLRYQPALDKYLSALAHNSFLPELHLNLGLAFEGLSAFEKAQQSYKQAEFLAKQKSDLLEVFVARFNQAQLLGKGKKFDEALDMYQKALEIVPSSKEVKINIELLIQSQQKSGKSDDKDNKDKKDSKDKDKKGKEQQQKEGEGKDDKDSKDDKVDKKYKDSAKYKPRPFEGKELNEGDVKKILGEIKQQESKIRAEYNRKEMKERPRDKDW